MVRWEVLVDGDGVVAVLFAVVFDEEADVDAKEGDEDDEEGITWFEEVFNEDDAEVEFVVVSFVGCWLPVTMFSTENEVYDEAAADCAVFAAETGLSDEFSVTLPPSLLLADGLETELLVTWDVFCLLLLLLLVFSEIELVKDEFDELEEFDEEFEEFDNNEYLLVLVVLANATAAAAAAAAAAALCCRWLSFLNRLRRLK